MTETFFSEIDPIPYEGPDTANDLAFRHYDPDRVVLGKRMEDHLRFATCSILLAAMLEKTSIDASRNSPWHRKQLQFTPGIRHRATIDI